MITVENKNYIMQGEFTTHKLDKYHLIFCPSYKCNLSCKHCYLPSHDKEILKFSSIKKLLSEWSQIVRKEKGQFNGIFHIKGGEPLLLPYLYDIFDILIKEKTCSLMITTNGTFENNNFFSKIKELDEKLNNTSTIIVSLDGSNEDIHSFLRGYGNFDKTISFISHLVEQNINVHLNYVVHSKNLFDIEDFLNFAISLGVSQVNFLKFTPKGFGQSIGECAVDNGIYNQRMIELYETASFEGKKLLAGNLGDIIDKGRNGSCISCECVGGYKGLLYVIPNGDVFSCPNLLEPDMYLGNIYYNSIEGIHNDAIDKLYYKIKSKRIPMYLCQGENISVMRNDIENAINEYQNSISYCYSRNF